MNKLGRKSLLSIVIAIATMGAVHAEQALQVDTSGQATEVTEQATETANIQLELFYMHSKGDDNFFLDALAEFENVIVVSNSDLIRWGIEKRDLHHGQKFSGEFDFTGWDLLGLEKINK